jgi:hypothetical protein
MIGAMGRGANRVTNGAKMIRAAGLGSSQNTAHRAGMLYGRSKAAPQAASPSRLEKAVVTALLRRGSRPLIHEARLHLSEGMARELFDALTHVKVDVSPAQIPGLDELHGMLVDYYVSTDSGWIAPHLTRAVEFCHTHLDTEVSMGGLTEDVLAQVRVTPMLTTPAGDLAGERYWLLNTKTAALDATARHIAGCLHDNQEQVGVKLGVERVEVLSELAWVDPSNALVRYLHDQFESVACLRSVKALVKANIDARTRL